MSFLSRLGVVSPKASSAFCLFVCVLMSMGNAQATIIDFDDLNPADFIDADAGEYIPLSNQYETQGVIFEGGAYLFGASGKSAPNYITGPGFSVHFIRDLPTYVSMYVGSGARYKVDVSAYGVGGYIETKTTDGEVHGLGWEQSTPYRENQFVSFFAAEGIAYIHLAGQADVYMDDLSFSVPEPAAWILFSISGLLLSLRRKWI